MPPSMISPDTITTSPRAALGADESREADRAGRAGNVLDRRGVDDAGALQRLLHHARGLIPAAAGRGRGDEAQVLVDRLRGGRCRGEGKQEQSGKRGSRTRHARIVRWVGWGRRGG